MFRSSTCVVKEKLIESFKRAANDSKIIEMTDEGLDDFLGQLDRFEK